MTMTDSQLKKFFNQLLRDEHDFDDLSIAIALFTAMGKFDRLIEVEEENFERRVSER